MDKIADLRKLIDIIDDEIIALLEERYTLTKKIGNVKALSKTNVLDTKREKYILDKTSKYNHSPEIGIVYKTIMEASKSLQRK
ncbi:MAG: chorismate mutase [Candidatus Izimaplasma sp.]|nr:chorismate mutase [Candidatus Izimaplasma bacterium]